MQRKILTLLCIGIAPLLLEADSDLSEQSFELSYEDSSTLLSSNDSEEENFYTLSYDEWNSPIEDDNTCCGPIMPDGLGLRSHSVYRHRQGELECAYAHQCGQYGIWFPEEPPLFKPFIADPREICYSVGYRFFDNALANKVVDVSFGDALPIYEWCDVWPLCGQLRLEIQGAAWAVFAPHKETGPLLNTDYYIGVPITYAIDRLSFRLRGFHISSHLGDEFMVLHKNVRRFNPSAEYLDLSASYHITDDIRIYGVIGGIVHQDKEFKYAPFYGEAGLELRLYEFSYTDLCNKLIGVPFYGMHFRFSRDFKHHVDSTYVLGYEWAKFYGLCRKMRVYIEYHDGYSVEGQFSRCATNYLSLRLSYGY